METYGYIYHIFHHCLPFDPPAKSSEDARGSLVTTEVSAHTRHNDTQSITMQSPLEVTVTPSGEAQFLGVKRVFFQEKGINVPCNNNDAI